MASVLQHRLQHEPSDMAGMKHILFHYALTLETTSIVQVYFTIPLKGEDETLLWKDIFLVFRAPAFTC